MSRTVLPHRILSGAVVTRLALGWGAFAATRVAAPVLESHLPAPALAALLAALIAVIVVCAFGVVAEAEHLARRLGDPYGTLVLTLSIVMIEVILISAVMLGPGEHPTIARDSVMAVSMIILNLVIGVSLLVGATRHARLRPHRTGASAYLAMLLVLSMLAFALPAVIGAGGAYTPAQAVPIALLTVALYAFFLFRQAGPQRADFQEVVTPSEAVATPNRMPVGAVIRLHRRELLTRTLVLVATVVPIVLLSHDMAALLDDGLGRLRAPTALSGILIAAIVFLPETITAVRAAWMGEIQRVSNLCHGALVSTVGLTIPAVLTIGLVTGQTVVLAETPANLLLLGVSLALTATTFLAPRVTPLHGAAHLLVFVVYGMTVFA